MKNRYNCANDLARVGLSKAQPKVLQLPRLCRKLCLYLLERPDQLFITMADESQIAANEAVEKFLAHQQQGIRVDARARVGVANPFEPVIAVNRLLIKIGELGFVCLRYTEVVAVVDPQVLSRRWQ